MENLNNVENELLKKITDTDDFSGGAYNIRQNGKGVSRKTTENIRKQSLFLCADGKVRSFPSAQFFLISLSVVS